MSIDSRESSDDYHSRVALVANELATALQETGLDATIERAQLEAENFQHSYQYLMRQASHLLFLSEDPALQEHGLGYMAWEAEHFPDPAAGNGIAFDAKFDARKEEHREFASRCFEISLMHFRFAAQQEGFIPTANFFEEFNAVTSRMIEEGYPGLYVSAITEFTPLAIAAATDYKPNAAEQIGDMDYGKHTIDEVLIEVYDVLRDTNPEIAQKAKALVTDESLLDFAASTDVDVALKNAFAANDFETAHKTLANTEHHLIQRLWGPVLQKLSDRKPENIEWASKVLGTIKGAVPDYFKDQGYVDLFLGRDVGMIVGLVGSTDVMNDIVSAEREENMCFITTVNIAHGLGLQNNQDGFDHLLTRIPHFSDEIRDAVHAHFDAGIQEASAPAAQ